jgi:ABC-2 type transport system permease protein
MSEERIPGVTRSLEWRLLRADRGVQVVAVLFIAVIAYGLFNGVSWVRFQEETISGVQTEERARLTAHKATIGRLAGGDTSGVFPWTDPRVPSNAGGTLAARYTILPPASLASLAVGQSDLYPYYAKISTRTKQTFIVNDEIENPTNLLSGRFDLSFVIVYLFPLVILALTYNLVSAEREQGTLALLLSQPVPARRVLARKLGIRAAVVFALAVGVTVVGALLSGVDVSRPDALPRLATWVAVVALYGAIWFAAAVAVNTLGRGSATNAVILLSAWLAVVVLLPSLYNVAITTAIPSPSRVEMTTALREATNEANEQGTVLMQRYYLDHPELMGGDSANMNNYAARSIVVLESVERSMGPTLAQFDARLVEQQRLADRYRFVSPALVTQSALLDVAGTSAHRYAHFQRLVDEYHAQWRAFFFPKVFSRAQLAASDYDRLPAFQYREESVAAVMNRVAPGLVALALVLALVASFAWRRLGRIRLIEAQG